METPDTPRHAGRRDGRTASPGLRQVAGGRAAEPPLPPPSAAVSPLPPDRTQAILEATKQVAALLKAGGHRFALAGSVAAYAHGVAAGLQHDTDFCLLREDADAVTRTLREGGILVRTPSEDWLLKASDGGEEIDLIFELGHQPVTEELLKRAETLPVDSVRMPVLTPTDLVGSLVAAFSEHHCDFGAALPVARTLRERVDWEALRREHGDAPMPAAFFFLLERLEVIDAPDVQRPG